MPQPPEHYDQRQLPFADVPTPEATEVELLRQAALRLLPLALDLEHLQANLLHWTLGAKHPPCVDPEFRLMLADATRDVIAEVRQLGVIPEDREARS